MSAKRAKGRENPPRADTGTRISEDHDPRAATRATSKMDIGLWKMDNGQKEKEKGKWKMASDKKQVASKREMLSEMF